MSSKFGTKINVDAVIGYMPKKAHENDAAYDLFVKYSNGDFSKSTLLYFTWFQNTASA